MNETTLFFRFGVAAFIGILIGLQREFSFDTIHKEHEIAAGVRTYTLFSLAGCLSAFLSDSFHSYAPFIVTIAVAGLLIGISYFVDATHGRIGLTSRFAGLCTLLIGALCFTSHLALAVALAVGITVILSVKFELQSFIKHITRADVFATLKFSVITAIILPVLPNKLFGPPPFTIINPFKIWLFVVFISGISFIGYILIKIAGPKKGIGLTGLLGGLASSTAVTASLTPRSKETPAYAKSFALAILVAWTVMFFRVIIAVAVLNIHLAKLIWMPLTVSMVAGLIYCVYLHFSKSDSTIGHDVEMNNPFELGLAIKFGLLFVLILVISKAAQLYLGSAGIYLSSFFAGLADVDAIALSMARLSGDAAGIGLPIAARAIVLATLANTILKGIIALAGGHKDLRTALLPGFIIMLITAAGAMFLIPG